MRKQEFIIATFVVVLFSAIAFLWFGPSGLQPAPDIEFTTMDGKKIDLKTLKGKPVLVTFWATSCPGCIKEMPDLAKMKQALGDRFELVAVSMDYDPAEQVQKFIKSNPYPFTFVMDTDGQIAKAFGDVKLTPTSFLIAPNGKIVYRQVGEVQFEMVAERIKQMSPQF